MRSRMRTRTEWLKGLGIFITALALPGVALAQDVRPPKEAYEAPKKEYSPYAGDHFPTRVLFGDTHLHTSWSTDVGMAGATLGPDVAYRVSRGEEVTSQVERDVLPAPAGKSRGKLRAQCLIKVDRHHLSPLAASQAAARALPTDAHRSAAHLVRSATLPD